MYGEGDRHGVPELTTLIYYRTLVHVSKKGETKEKVLTQSKIKKTEKYR